MKKGLMAVVAVCALRGWGAEAVLEPGGMITISQPEITFHARLATEDWKKTAGGTGFTFPDQDGFSPFTMELDKRTVFTGKARMDAEEQGAARIRYQFRAEEAITLASLYVTFPLPVASVKGATWSADGEKEGGFPEQLDKMTVMSGHFKRLTVTYPDGRRLQADFDTPTSLLIQDDRRWGSDTFAFRFILSGRAAYKKGESREIAFTFRTDTPLAVSARKPVVIRPSETWIPLRYTKTVKPGSALDFSIFGFCDGPAGKYGWLVVRDGHFEFEKRPGIRQRFYGVNLCFTACFPSPEESEILAERLVRLGYNTVRIHHYDQGLVEGARGEVKLNETNLAKLDALLAALMRRGIYITTDVYVSRKIDWKQIGIDRPGEMEKQLYKSLCAVHEPAMEDWKAFARAFLGHVNPHTGRRYADEPGLPLLSLINEGSIAWRWGDLRQMEPFKNAWARWVLDRRRLADEGMPGDDLTGLPDEPPERMCADLAQFLADIEARMARRMAAFLRDELKCRALLTNQNCGPHYLPMQITRDAVYDYVDDHFYVDHPSFLQRSWSLPSRCDNSNRIRSKMPPPAGSAYTRLVDKPFTLTEYNFSGPGRYRGVGGIMTGAMAALQDWDGMWRFAYSHNLSAMMTDGVGLAGYFDISTDPLSQASDRATICLFLRGDLPVAPQSAVIEIPRRIPLAAAEDRKGLPAPGIVPNWGELAWRSRIGTRVANGKPVSAGTVVIGSASAYGGETPEAVTGLMAAGTGTGCAGFAMDADSGSFTLNTRQTCGGFAESGTIDVGAIRFTVDGAPATVWVSALDREPVAASRRLLLSHLTDVQADGNTYAEPACKTLLKWGSSRTLVRAGTADITLRLTRPEAYSVYSLAAGGERLEKVPARVEAGALRFTASVAGGPDGARMLYEIVRE
ncbi:MAG: hypothetical protein J6334_01960 [Kiritimatiellae bacterium]|nr:hypothetical protein [Kiritimatiellia bacterium]